MLRRRTLAALAPGAGDAVALDGEAGERQRAEIEGVVEEREGELRDRPRRVAISSSATTRNDSAAWSALGATLA